MATESAGRKAAYEQARAAFEDLSAEDKATFVVEATFNAVGQAFKDAGRVVADAVERVQREDFWKQPEEEAPSSPDPGEATTAP